MAKVIVEGSSIDSCRAQGADMLGVAKSDVEVSILQHKKKGLFQTVPYRVEVISKDDADSRARSRDNYLDKLSAEARSIAEEVDKVDRLGGDDEETLFSEMLEQFSDLDDTMREELTDLSLNLRGSLGDKLREHTSKDGSCDLVVSDDEMEVVMSVYPPSGAGQWVTYAQVLQMLKDRGVVSGVDHVSLRRILEQHERRKETITGRVVAKGESPSKGRDGKIEFMPDLKITDSMILYHEDGLSVMVDDEVITAKEGVILARAIPPVPGKPGVSVMGKPVLSHPGEESYLVPGENVVFDEEQGTYTAAASGQLVVHNGEIFVKKLLIIKGNVDAETGDVDFYGTVIVRGDVRSGFILKAGEDVEIQGCVEASKIESETGNVRIKGGISGGGKAIISAAKDVTAKYIENACVHALHDVTSQSAIIHSEVTAGNAVKALVGKGAILGGVIRARNSIEAKKIGSDSSTHTILMLGIGVEQQREMYELDSDMSLLRIYVAKLEGSVEELQRTIKDINRATPAEQETLLNMKKKLIELRYKLFKREKKRDEIVSSIELEANGQVRVLNAIFPGTSVRSGHATLSIRNQTAGKIFKYDKEKESIVTKSLY